MQNEEKIKLEQRIIAYFDGSLNGAESRSLLADVSKSTESRALFKGYESLQRIISASRIPMEMPMEAKRSIAERIPGLIAFIPGLLGGAQALPVITQSASPFMAFLAKIPLSTAISVGTSVAVLTTAGVIVKNKLDDNAAIDQKAKTAIVQNHFAQPSAQVYAELPKRDFVVPQVGHSGAVFAASEIGGFMGQRTKGTEVTKATRLSANLADVSESRAAGGRLSKSSIASSKSGIASNDVPASNIPTSMPQSVDQSPTTPAINLTASPRPVPGVAADIPGGGYGILRPMPEMFGEELMVKPFIAYGIRMQFSNTSSSIAQAGGFTEDIRAGLDIPLTSELAVRVQGGNTQFAHEMSQAGQSGQFGGIGVYGKYTSVNIDAAYWATAGIAYQIYAMDAIPLTVSGGVGVAFLQTKALLFDLSVSPEIPVSTKFVIKPGISFQSAYTSETQGSASTPPASAIIQNSEFSKTSMWSNSLGVNIGFMFRY